MRERGFQAQIEEEETPEGKTVYRSQALADAMNALYIEKVQIGFRVLDDGETQKPLALATISPGMFEHARAQQKLAYLKGTYRRYGRESTFRLFNAGHKAKVVAQLLRDLGCTEFAIESTQGRAPQTNVVRFVPSPEVRDALQAIA